MKVRSRLASRDPRRSATTTRAPGPARGSRRPRGVRQPPKQGSTRDRVALGVEARAQVRAVDRRRRLLERAHVVDGVAPRGREVGVLEARPRSRRDRAGTSKRRHGSSISVGERLAGRALRADAHDLDRRDRRGARRPGGSTRRGTGARGAPARAPRALSSGAARLLRRSCRPRAPRSAAPRASATSLPIGARPPRRVHEVEPEQDARAAGAVDLAPHRARPRSRRGRGRSRAPPTSPPG